MKRIINKLTALLRLKKYKNHIKSQLMVCEWNNYHWDQREQTALKELDKLDRVQRFSQINADFYNAYKFNVNSNVAAYIKADKELSVVANRLMKLKSISEGFK